MDDECSERKTDSLDVWNTWKKISSSQNGETKH